MTNKTILMTSIIAMTFLIGFTANEAYAGVGDAEPCEDFCTINIEVNIDIKPGSDPNSINTKSMGVVPVAILGSADFDVTTVVPTSLKFMVVGDNPTLDTSNLAGFGFEDVNDDGFLDLVAHFPTQTIGINCLTTEGQLYGHTMAGVGISGFDSINPVGKDCRITR